MKPPFPQEDRKPVCEEGGGDVWGHGDVLLHASSHPSASDTSCGSFMSGFSYPWTPLPALLSTTSSPKPQAVGTLPDSAQYPDLPCK